jgi:hypothetical protein
VPIDDYGDLWRDPTRSARIVCYRVEEGHVVPAPRGRGRARVKVTDQAGPRVGDRSGSKRAGGLARGMKVEMANAGMGRAEGKTARVGKSVFFFSFHLNL